MEETTSLTIPVPTITYITSPSSAKALLGSEEQNANELLKSMRSDLITLYKDGKLNGRKYTQLSVIQSLCNACDESLRDSADQDDENKRNDVTIINTIKFLAILAGVEKIPGYNEDRLSPALRKFMSQHFNINAPERKLYDICIGLINELAKSVPPEKLDFPIPQLESSESKSGLMDKFKFWLSVFWNRLFKSARDQMSEHIWLGQIPTVANIGELKKECDPSLIVSAVEPREFFTLKSIATPEFWRKESIGQIFLSKFIDFGRPHRNAKFERYKNPLTNQKFKHKEGWNQYLDILYTDIYYAAKLTAAYIQQGKKIYLHCKAGKGRSVTTLGVFYLLHPEELGITLSGNIKNDVDMIWQKMCEKRPHIDKDEETKQAVIDCYDYILKNFTLLDKKSLVDIRNHFNGSVSPISPTSGSRTPTLKKPFSKED